MARLRRNRRKETGREYGSQRKVNWKRGTLEDVRMEEVGEKMDGKEGKEKEHFFRIVLRKILDPSLGIYANYVSKLPTV
jgi:hypothetical protein